MASIIRSICDFFGELFGDVIRIDRSTPFDPAKFFGLGWSIWRGPVDGDGLSGDEDQDQRSLGLIKVNISKIFLETCLKKDERNISGEEKLCRLKASGRTRLDAKVFQTLWNRHRIPKRWMEEGTKCITFDGTVLRSPIGRRYVMCFYWDAYYGWRSGHSWLIDDWRGSNRSAVL